MRVVRGIVKATNATLNIGIGFKPDFVKVLNGDDRTGLEFDNRMTHEQPYGQTVAAAGDKADAASAAAGIELYDGATPLASASTTCLTKDKADKKGSVTKFTIDTAGSKTGHFDAGLTTADVGVGSKVMFGDGTLAEITSLTNDGDDTDEVTLDTLPEQSDGLSSHDVSKIYALYDYSGAAAGEAVPAGFTIGASATVNDTSGDILLFEAGSYDG
jgi:hypothetical protein